MAGPTRAAISRAAVGSLVVSFVVASCGNNETDPLDEPIRVAVAANFAAAHHALEERFERETGMIVEASLGSTGALYAQITNGAPYHIFLAADVQRPRLLENEGLVAPGGRRTYAIGRLALYAPKLHAPALGPRALRTESFEYLAIADPRTAPYGTAAEEVLRAWKLLDTLEHRIVRGGNVSQTLQFVESGAAELGVVAWSQVVGRASSSYWIVPDSLHRPIVQDAVLLARGANHPNARSFFDFLISDEARGVITTFGYTVP